MGSPLSAAGIADLAQGPTIQILTKPTARPEPVNGLRTNEALARWASQWAAKLDACNADKAATAYLLTEAAMPEGFDQCARNGGKVRRVSGPNEEHGLKEGEYVDYCHKDGQSHRGHVKQKKTGG